VKQQVVGRDQLILKNNSSAIKRGDIPQSGCNLRSIYTGDFQRSTKINIPYAVAGEQRGFP
jgi:hypothetical protein